MGCCINRTGENVVLRDGNNHFTDGGDRSDDWPARHSCVRHAGHPSLHRCWCGALHDPGADYTGRWEDYMKPELKGSKPKPDTTE
jgi:hypothetical protein